MEHLREKGEEVREEDLAWVSPLVREPWLNEGLEPGVRATVISMGSQAGAFGEASAGPVIGAIGNAAGVRAALTTAALILSPALLLYARAIRRHEDTNLPASKGAD